MSCPKIAAVAWWLGLALWPAAGVAQGADPIATDRRAADPAPLGSERPREDPLSLTQAASADRHALRVRYTLQGIEIRGNSRTSTHVVLRYVPFHSGDVLDVDDPEMDLTRFRLLGTGFFSNVQMSLRKGNERGHVILVVDVVERNTLVVRDLWLGLAQDATLKGERRALTAYAGADIAETNLAGTGVTLGGAIAFTSDQLALRTRFLDPALLGSRFMLSATLLYSGARDFFGKPEGTVWVPGQAQAPRGSEGQVDDNKLAVVDYQRFGGTLGIGHDLSVPTQVWFDYRLEQINATLPLLASTERGIGAYRVREPIAFDILPERSVLSTLRATLLYDTRDQPILPTRGWYAAVIGESSLAPVQSEYSYSKLQIRASRFWPLPWQHTARLELFVGTVTGNAPFFEKFYVGDLTDLLPDRVLDLNSDRRTAPNFFRTSIGEVRYGDYAAKVQGEYRIPLYRGQRAVYGIDLFGAVGLYGVATRRDLVEPAPGYHGFHKVPVDLTFNVGLRIDTKAGGFLFAFSNLLGFLPTVGGGGN